MYTILRSSRGAAAGAGRRSPRARRRRLRRCRGRGRCRRGGGAAATAGRRSARRPCVRVADAAAAAGARPARPRRGGVTAERGAPTTEVRASSCTSWRHGPSRPARTRPSRAGPGPCCARDPQPALRVVPQRRPGLPGGVSCGDATPVRAAASSRCSPRPATACRRATAGCSSRSGTASGRSCSATATRSTSRAATSSRSTATSPSSPSRCKAQLPERCVLDGEIVIAGDGRRSTSRRCCCASTRPRRGCSMLAARDAGVVRAWDLLALGDEDLRGAPAGRAARAGWRRRSADATPPVHLTPATRDRALAADWFDRFEGAGLDGVVAKRLDGAVPAGQAGDAQDQARAHRRLRRRRLPLAQERARARTSGRCCSGLYDDEGTLHHVGITSSFTWDKRARRWSRSSRRCARARSRATRGASGPSGRRRARPTRPASGCPARRSRWNRGKDLSWEPLRAERVVEVAYDHLQGDRFRHATTFRRWRPDKQPADCRYDQLETTAPVRARADLRRHLGGGRRHPVQAPSPGDPHAVGSRV